ncbi:bifunctional folylpolyglutamate synthase/dihydrofolate synthase [Commensalibacter papalotli (ex Servin-Garciduenas et al. 2014)]|uniref:tetrahydrofolate synthase n=1 Tax=Commensalibacter papalotli (ex Servin-Garciduenas et al. 2014) TaxID=1208583 RepID=W7E487_9PROT|nr:folylpolyglutamate synthase/dihydrofolate synthase family protein [Commensalibacter papalotli (ex Servin-Garciduenas et al. 2014)]EUK17876.1 bifunctional folylpolyglutamate synthase/ dihydrofolate synthase [Commensalibacter papalotli (ex Servin-Garciduenas et al. 2014)]
MSSSSSSILTEFSGRSGQILERLNTLYPALIDLSLDRLKRLLNDLGNPQQKMPPIIHVAGTNGKGSTCAFLRAIGEEAGLKVHVSTSPHLVDVTERFRIAGELVSENELSEVLMEIERVNNQQPITVFEVLTAAAFVLFSKNRADLAIIEVGLGGRFDATNVITPMISIITSISMDHEAFLGDNLAKIAHEKAGIIKENIPVIVDQQKPEALRVIKEVAQSLNAPCLIKNQDWSIIPTETKLFYKDAKGELELPLPSLLGEHQFRNAGLAITALRTSQLPIPDHAYQGIAKAVWPARLQRLYGQLINLVPSDCEIWLDGGHNPDAGQVLAQMIQKKWQDKPLHLIVGMKDNKNVREYLAPLIPLSASIQAVMEPDQHLAMPITEIIKASDNYAISGGTVEEALSVIKKQATSPVRILICGSLYLAGSVLKQDQ